MRKTTLRALAALAVASCTESVPLEGMPCPCTEGYVCCAYKNQCQAPETACEPTNPGEVPPVCGPSHGAGSSAADPGAPVDTLVEPIACDGSNADLTGFKYAPGYAPDPALQANVQALLAQMSLTEKADQMRGTAYGNAGMANFSDIQRSPDTATIRGFRYRDGARGMNLTEDMEGAPVAGAVLDGVPVGYATAFPVPIARGAAFDLDLEYAVGEAIGDEMQAAGQTVALAPSVNMLRHPLWGRAQETYGEDPFHIGRLASAMTVGIQQHIAATAKAFAAYDVEIGRAIYSPILDEQTLRESFGRHFRMVVQDAGVASVMAAHNEVNGVKSTENEHLLSQVLRADFGFKGFVMSDWWAMTNGVNVGDTTAQRMVALNGLRAGLDVELPWALNYGMLESIVQSDAPPRTSLDEPVARILEQKLRFNAHPLTGQVGLGVPQSVFRGGRVLCDADHIALAERAALESMVLLKNDNSTLPIKAATKVAVIGAKVPFGYKSGTGRSQPLTLDFATDANTGDMGTSRVVHDPAKQIGPFAGIKAAAPAGVTVVAGNTAADAADADFVVVIAGLTAGDEGEEFTGAGDRVSFALDAKQSAIPAIGAQDALITKVIALGKPMVVVLEGSSVIDMPWLAQVPAVVMAWYPGMVGGAALGKLLWGQVAGQSYNFSGKLPFTWSPSPADYGPFGVPGTRVLDYYVGYRRFDQYDYGLHPLYGFGHGLSYTRFAYRKLQLGCSDLGHGGVLPVVVNVANTGEVAGDEVVMVFVSFPGSKARRPVKELKGFTRVHLAVGEEKQVTVPVRLSDLDYFQIDPVDANTGRWVVESGEVRIMVGGSSTDLPLAATVRVNGY